jgi:hypothetical protein
VNQVDGAGNATPHDVLHHLPYFRLQGGSDAVILDPKVGDIGLAGFASRDISSVKSTKAQANPGSARSFDMADGVYIGGMLNGVPEQYVQFTQGGINIVSPHAVTVNAGGDVAVTAIGNATIKAATAVVTAGSIALQNAGSALKALLNSIFSAWAETHVHSNGNGGSNTGAPTTLPPSDSKTSIVKAE